METMAKIRPHAEVATVTGAVYAYSASLTLSERDKQANKASTSYAYYFASARSLAASIDIGAYGP